MCEEDCVRLAAIAAAANRIARWCAVRDFATPQDLAAAGGVDLWVCFGGGVVEAVDVLAEAMRAPAARRYAIVGGVGHSTYGVRAYAHAAAERGELPTSVLSAARIDRASEAELFSAFLEARYGLRPDFIETRSSNCGNNIAFLLDELEHQGAVPCSIVLSQDAVMQRRMGATLSAQVGMRTAFAGMCVQNYAYYRAEVAVQNGRLAFAEPVPRGMWNMDDYLSMLVSEVARLTDNAQGYGPKGKGFIAHVDVPASVTKAAEELRRLWGGEVLWGDPRWAAPAGE